MAAHGMASARMAIAPLETAELHGSSGFWLLFVAFFVVMALIVRFHRDTDKRRPSDRLPPVG